MASRFKLYNSDGVSLEYTFPLVQETNAPQSPQRAIVIEGARGQGCIVVNAGEQSWDLTIRGVLAIDTSDEGYEEIVVKIDALETAVPINTPFYIRIYKTSSTYYDYKVKRILPIDYTGGLRNYSQEYSITFKVNSWV